MRTYCWLESVPLAAIPIARGAAPPSSRKLIETPELPPRLEEANPPLKYGRRLTAVPLTVPGARIPATGVPVLVSETERCQL